jgi:hypothetical protein
LTLCKWVISSTSSKKGEALEEPIKNETQKLEFLQGLLGTILLIHKDTDKAIMKQLFSDF